MLAAAAIRQWRVHSPEPLLPPCRPPPALPHSPPPHAARAAIGTDVLVQRFAVAGNMVHDVGGDGRAHWCVFEGGRMSDGNLELHRALAAQVRGERGL